MDSLNSLLIKTYRTSTKRTAAEIEVQRKKMEEKNQRLTDQGFNPGTDPFNERTEMKVQHPAN